MKLKTQHGKSLLYFNADKGNGGGASPDVTPPGDPSSTVAENLRKLLDKHNGDALALAAALFDEKYADRESHRKVREQKDALIAELQAKIPGDGALVLQADEAEAWQAYRSLGTPDSLAVTMRNKDELQGELARLRKEQTLNEVAAATGWNLVALQDLDRTNPDPLEYTIQRGDDGKTAVLVKVGEEQKPLPEYVAEKRPALLPALQTEQGVGQQGRAVWPQQVGGAGAAGGKPTEAVLRKTMATRARPPQRE